MRNQRVTREENKHFSPALHLVGFSGQVLRRKLKPLRRSRADKIREKTLEQDYLDKCNSLACQLKNHGHLLELMLQLTCCNGEDLCDSSLCQELKKRHDNSTKLIKFLLERVGTTIDVLPNQIQASLRQLLQKDKKLRVKISWRKCLQGRPSFTIPTTVTFQREKTSSVRDEFYQIFVHGIKEDRPLVLMLKQVELGRALKKAVQKKCPNLPSSFILLHRGRKILDERALNEQGLTQDCNIHVQFSLCGGMEKEKDPTTRNGGERSKKAPQKWKKAQVVQWINEVCEIYEIEEDDVSKLKTLSGGGLMKLKRQDWMERSPNQGDLFFNLWTELLEKSAQERGSDSTKSSPNSPRKESAENVVKSAGDNFPLSTGPSPIDSASSMSPNSEEVTSSAISSISKKRAWGPQGPFGAVENLKEGEHFLTIDQLSKLTPAYGELISVKGVCSSSPQNSGGAGTVLIRTDDPVEGDIFLQLKVDIRACPNSTILTKHVISSILNVKLGEHLYVKGEIQPHEKSLKSIKKAFKILPFKVVVDSDHHAAFRKDVKVQRSYLRQVSIPWPTEYGIFPAEGPTQERLFQNDSLESTYGNVFCPPDAPIEQIKESAVALKNSVSGDIFVGVKGDGTVIGSLVSRDTVIQKRDKLVRALCGILPCVNKGMSICTTAAEAHEFVEKEKDFVAAMYLQSKDPSLSEHLRETDEISILFRIHVAKGTSVVSFVKPEHTHAYTRIGTETKLMTDYEDLFNRLESLASRNIPEKTEKYINQEVNKASTYDASEENYNLFKRVKFETEKREFKVIFGDPKEIILKDYIKKYAASFINSHGGDIYFGIYEDKQTSSGYVVGISMPVNDKRELLHESSQIICNFWPPVDSCQFFIKFIEVNCDISKSLLKYPKTYVERKKKFLTVHFEDNSKVQKLVNFARTKIGQCAVLRLENKRFGLLVKDASKLNAEEFFSALESKSENSRDFQMGVASFEEIEPIAKGLCVVHLHVRASPLPIHLTSPFLTFSLDQQGTVTEMKPNQLLERFVRRDYQYEPDKLMNAANGFEKENTSYVLISSPFCLPKQERDLYGLVVPGWALVLDFDQTPNQEGHLLKIFKPLHDLHQVERNLFVKTPLDRRLDVNPRNGVCWCAVRGYEDIDKTLSKEGHASWLMSHGHKMRPLIEQLIVHINPNPLVVVCLWDDGHEKLLPSVDMLLQLLFSCWPPTKAIFVCSNSSAKAAVLSLLIEPLERAGFEVKRDNIFVALPHEMARHVGAELPPPYRSEDAFQIPRKFCTSEGERTIPDTLPQTIRQATKGHLQIMYQNTGTACKSKPEDEDKVRVKFYSGSEIDETGLANGIAIEREKMKELKKEMKSFLNDKRSHVCLTILKAERGAGATTLCLQLLYEFHKQYVCARLLEFHDSLATNIEKINQYTRLPIIIFVDSEMSYLPEFNDFKNEAERRNLNLKLLIVESDLSYSQPHTSNKKKQSIPYFVGTAAYKTVELSRELTPKEAAQLVDQFLKIKEISEEKKNKLKGLKERVSSECALRKFAIVSLTVFGRKFTGLQTYVAYRLAQITDELQLQILEFLALIHVYTDFLFPVNALARLAKKEVVMLERIFSNDDVRELLSPPSSSGKNVRRMSFVEVAEEVLKQQAKKREIVHTFYLKDVAIRLAKCALSYPRPSKRIDRITRRLYVTSEYGDEKFSPLVREMRKSDPDVARDMLHDLSEIFEKGSSVWAHLLAHLAKYYMSEYEDFPKAIPLIEEAVRENKDDVLLHHIHGDIIRLHVQNLKDQERFSLDEVLRYAIQSSHCFVTVKHKRPLMEHGYSSDALIRKVVMLAAIKSVGGSHFVDFLKAFLIQRKVNEKSTDNLSLEDKYILSLVPDFFDNLREVPIKEFSAKLKDDILENLGELDDLKVVCEDLKETLKDTSDEAWVDKVVLNTMSLVYSLEVEKKQLKPHEADERIKSLEELLTKTDSDEGSMKIWIRCVRLGSKVPQLKAVRRKVDGWLKATGRRSPNALFYNYVVGILEALSDPNDTEKMKRANECVKELQHKRRLRSKGISQDPSLPVEWLHPKEGRHINSLDSLLNHEDLVRDYLKGATPRHPDRAGKEIIEKALFQKSITKWEGVVSEISSDWKGIISLKRHINVSFVPVNAQPFMPNQGDEVHFCLAFHWTGPTAWGVFCPPGVAKAQKAVARSAITFPTHPEEDDSDSETSEKGDEEDLLPLVGESLYTQAVKSRQNVLAENEKSYQWSHYLDQEMQGIILKRFSERGYGGIFHPNFQGNLFFHAKQIVPPVDSLDSIELYCVVSFTVGESEKGPRAMNIKTVEETNIDVQLKEYRDELLKEQNAKDQSTSEAPQRTAKTVSLPKTLEDLHLSGSRPEGQICELRCPPNYKSVHGFIEIPTISEKLFFHESVSGIQRKELAYYRPEARVQFSVGKREKGFFAKDLYIKPPETKQVQCNCGWEDSVGKGLQEGYVGALKQRYGFITKEYPREPNRVGIYFHESDLKEYRIMQLNIGDRVHFKVGQNDKGCVAQQVDVLRNTQLVQQGKFQSTSASLDPRLFRGHDMFMAGQHNLGQFSQMRFSPPITSAGSSISPMRNSMPGARMPFPEEYGDGPWQNVTRRKR